MTNFHYLQPVLPVSGEVVTSGHFGDLKQKSGAVSVGLYNATNTPSQYYIATGSGNADRFFIGFSSPATKDSLDKWHFGRTNPIKSHEFRGKDIISFEFSNPTRIQKEIWNVGWTGVAGCNEKPFSFECGKTYGMMVSLSGSPTFRQWAKSLRHEIYVTTPCCDSDECETGCLDSAFDCGYVYKEFAKKINEHNELSLMGVKARYITSTYASTSPTHYDYCLSVCDGGSVTDLAAVQSVVTAGKVSRTGREGGISTYQVSCIASIPSTFTPVSPVALADCGVCAAGFTLVGATDTYTVVANESTYANAAAVTTAYQNATTKTFNGTVAGVDIATEIITVTAHGFVTGQRVLYSNGGGTAPTGLTNATNYFVIKVTNNTLKLATTLVNAMAGTAINITAVGLGTAHTLTASSFSTTLASSNPTTEVYNLVVSSGNVVTALSTDTLIFSKTTEAMCNPAANSAVSWTECGSHYKVQRDLCMTLSRKECSGANYATEVAAMLAADPTYVANSLVVTAGTNCADKYTASQWSNCMDDACLSKDTASFDRILQGFANEDVIGVWEVIEDTIPVYDANKKCGLQIFAETSEVYLSDCVSQLNDFYETEPIRMEVNWIQNQLTGLPEACDTKGMPKAQRTQLPSYAAQTGEWFLREYIKQNAYTMMGCEETDPKMREILDQNLRPQVDRTAFYKLYYIKYRADKGNGFGFDQKGEFCEAMIGFKEGEQVKATQFETAFGNVFSKFNIVLTERK
jgi:hypothetical protein